MNAASTRGIGVAMLWLGSLAGVVVPASAESIFEESLKAEEQHAGGGCLDQSCCNRCSKPAHCCECLCGPSGLCWVRTEFLLWWTKGDRVPPLVTTSPAGTPRSAAGVIGQPGTTILFGDERINDTVRPGGRITIGTWLDRCQTWGLEGDYFALGEETTNFSASSTGEPILGRPFFNIGTGQQDAELVAFPDVVTGAINVDASSNFQGAGVRLLHNICCTRSCCDSTCYRACRRLDVIGGYRFLRLDDDLSIDEQLVSTDPAGLIAVGTQFDVSDRFSTENEFHGGDMGLIYRTYRGRWSYDILGRVALGNMHQVVQINGNTVVTVPGVAPVTRTGGLLTQTSNIGEFSRDEFAVVPELGLTVGYFLTERLRASIGYSLLYISNVVRPGDQIDPAVNPSLLGPGPVIGEPRPAFEFRDTDFWAQGLNFGLDMYF